MVDACRISSEVLNKMTTEEIVNAVLDYPLLINIYAYDSYEDGLKSLAKDSDAFKELLRRPDASEKLLNKLETKTCTSGTLESLDRDEGSLEELTVRILLTKTKSCNDRAYGINTIQSLRGNITVRTPNGTGVSVFKRGEELSSSRKQQIVNDMRRAYPRATMISFPTTNFNCHSYAWYSTSNSNKYWMNCPSAYMSDGSYSRLDNVIDAVSGTRMYYQGEHSAIVYRGGGPLSDPKYLTVKSKWGKGPLMKHVAEYSPYSSDNITLWTR